MSILGIDLSLTSPSLCIFDNKGTFDINRCTFYYFTSLKKTITSSEMFKGELYPEFTYPEERYDNISNWILDKVVKHDVECVYIEGYAFNAVGRVFQIAENTGVLKYRLWSKGLNCITVPPTVIKKFATGKGNANKEAMETSFISETGINLKSILQLTDKQWNPSSDIIDSYYVCKYGVFENGKEK